MSSVASFWVGSFMLYASTFEFFVNSFYHSDFSLLQWGLGDLIGAFLFLLFAKYGMYIFSVLSLGFLVYFIWTVVFFIRERKLDSTLEKYLPRLLGLLFALILSVTGLAFSIYYYLEIYV